jgi:hypothetical protein
MNEQGTIPGRWFELVFRSRKAERVQHVLATLRVAEIPVILEEEDHQGVVHVLVEKTPLAVRGIWSVFVPEASLRFARSKLRKLPFRITTDREGKGSHRTEVARYGQVMLWTGVFVASVLALIVVIQVWRGVLTISREDFLNFSLALGGVAIVLGLPIFLAWEDARRWLRARRRRFVAAAGHSEEAGTMGTG